MLRLESYVAPFLTSYLKRYIRNLTSEDLKLSIWGGDVVLTNLELKLDILESELDMPFAVESGHIHELRIHIPWMALASESVEITISTIEISLRLQDPAEEREMDDGACSVLSSEMSARSPRQKPPAATASSQNVTNDDESSAPGYIESLILKIGNNINVKIENLILKYVENDIVLSLNIKSIHLMPVGDENWELGWVEVTENDPVVRRLINIEGKWSPFVPFRFRENYTGSKSVNPIGFDPSDGLL